MRGGRATQCPLACVPPPSAPSAAHQHQTNSTSLAQDTAPATTPKPPLLLWKCLSLNSNGHTKNGVTLEKSSKRTKLQEGT